MDSKLKALKVVDLKDILAKAAVVVPSKSNKPDLIARILASPAAIDVYNAQFAPTKPASPPKRSSSSAYSDVATTPAQPPATTPSEVDYDNASPPPAQPPTPDPALSPQPVSASTPPPKPSTVTPSAQTEPSSSQGTAPKSPEDEELEKRKARAARFGTALVEPPKAKPDAAKPAAVAKAAGRNGSALTATAAPLDNPEKLAARAARFGLDQTAKPAQPQPAAKKAAPQAVSKKRSAPPMDTPDAEELERRRKRAERFGMPIVGAKA